MELLEQKPEGMKLCNITKHIYNSNCSLFDDEHLYKQIYETIRRFLWTQSKQKHSPFKSINDKWGVYGIKRSFVTQLELCFDNYEYDVPERKSTVKKHPQHLDLFAGNN